MSGGKQAPHLLIQAMAISMCSDPTGLETNRYIDFLIEIFEKFCTQNKERGLPPILNGHDLIQHFGLQPSPLLGTLLRRLEELHLAGAITRRQQAFEWVAQHLKSIQG